MEHDINIMKNTIKDSSMLLSWHQTHDEIL
jgi:hypothetical protein